MALRLVAAVVEGLGSSDRNLAALHTDALKAADKCLKDKSVSTANKSAAGAVIKAVAEAGGSGLWSSAGSAFDDIVRTCVLALVDPSLTVREVFAAALGEIAAASNASSAKDAVRPCPSADVLITCMQCHPTSSLSLSASAEQTWLLSLLLYPLAVTLLCASSCISSKRHHVVYFSRPDQDTSHCACWTSTTMRHVHITLFAVCSASGIMFVQCIWSQNSRRAIRHTDARPLPSSTLQVAGLDSKPSKKAALEQMVSQAVSTCLTKPLAEAAAANNRQALTALAQAWIAYLASMQAKYGADEPFLINTAAKLVELLASLGSSRASGVAVSDSGSAPGNDLGPGQGEMPHAQAAVLYVIRVGVMEQLSETGQVCFC